MRCVSDRERRKRLERDGEKRRLVDGGRQTVAQQEERKGARSRRSKRYIASVFEKEGGGKMMGGRLHY